MNKHQRVLSVATANPNRAPASWSRECSGEDCSGDVCVYFNNPYNSPDEDGKLTIVVGICGRCLYNFLMDLGKSRAPEYSEKKHLAITDETLMTLLESRTIAIEKMPPKLREVIEANAAAFVDLSIN